MTNAKHKTLMAVLTRALTVKRPHDSKEEQEFVAFLARTLPITSIDGAGNLHIKVGESKTLFTAHTDTVHYEGGVNKVAIDGKFWRATGDVLGADDGAGVAIIAHMIENKIPGLYVLFRSEEFGGLGSKYLADNHEDLLRQYNRAIAFDRAGYYDVITHQAGVRCCSDVFATALATALSDDLTWMMPSDKGIYTDTVEFIHLIPECTNVSVGYKNQHSTGEEQDIEFLKKLADKVLTVDWENLPTARNEDYEDDYLAPDREYALVVALEEFKKNRASGKLENLVMGFMAEVYDTTGININIKTLSKETVDHCIRTLDWGCSAYAVAEGIYNETVVI